MKSQFEEEILPAEMEEVSRRRRQRGLGCPDFTGRPSVRNGLTGLALSGGGIRSASFSLGVIQALGKKGEFRHIDYLSTVSGGGYIGSCVSSVLNREGVDESAFANREGEEDTPAVNHLRNSSNFLTSAATVDRLRLPMILLRGILVNIWLLIPPLILAVLITEVLTELWHRAGAPFISPLLIAAPFLVLALLYPPVIRVFGGAIRWKLRDLYEKVLAAFFGLSLLALVMVPVLWTVTYCIDNNWDGHIGDFFHVTTAAGGLLQLGIAVVGFVAFIFLINLSQVSPRFVRGVVNLIVAIIGPLVVFGVYLLFCVFFVESPYFLDEIEADGSRGTPATYSQILDELGESGGEALVKDQGQWEMFQILAEELRENDVDVPDVKDGDPNPVSAGPQATGTSDKVWFVSDGAGSRIRIEMVDPYLFIPDKSIFELNANWGFYGLGLILFLLNRLLFDANLTSTHGFYRDKLSRAFLFRLRGESDVESDDRLKLSELNAEGSVAPYHLINTTLNLAASTDVNLRGRKADFFTLSKRHCGGEQTGYCATTEIESADRNLNLGTAMAVSAAAAAPNMGTSTKKYFVFIMTLLNLRLGYWIPNPSKIVPAGWLRKLLWPNVGPMFLLKEAFGKLDAKGSRVNLSDGGHIENLAIYQLLRRRCKLIVAVDAEADPGAAFKGLVTLIRFARIDLGVRIELSLEDLRKDGSGLSKSHWILAKIHYGGGGPGEPEIGHLLYLKSSLTGDENEYVKAYRKDDPTFPHQTTADQFFDETQFEVYRSLGEHIANSALGDKNVAEVLPSAEKSRKGDDQ